MLNTNLEYTQEVGGKKLVKAGIKFPQALIALNSRNFRFFWLGQLISLTGTWMQSTGQDWLVLQLTHSAWLLGVVGALQFLPVLLLSLFSGVIADKFPKKKLLIGTQISSLTLATVLCILVLTGTVQLWHIFILATLLGITNSLDMPVRQSFVVEMVGRDTLPNAIALNSTSFNLARIIGPSIAGLLIGWFSGSEAPLFFFNALSFIPVIFGLYLIRSSELHNQPSKQMQAQKQGTFKSLGEGLSYIVRVPAIFMIIAIVGVISLFGINFNIILPLFASTVLNAGPQGYGFLSAAFGFGALLAAVWLAWTNKQANVTQLVISALLFGITEAIFAISHLYILSILFIAVVGFNQISFSARANSMLQAVTPNHLRGRIMSVYTIVFVGTTPIGNLAIGALSNAFGASIALLAGAIPCIIAAIAAWCVRKPAEKSINETH
jgi:MFS family permease